MNRQLMVLCALGAVVWFGSACAKPNINDLSSWRGCLVQSSYEPGRFKRGPLTAGDSTQLIYASFNGEANKYAVLHIEVPGALPKNKAVFVGGDDTSDFNIRYQQGTTMQNYDSNTVKGKVKVISFDQEKAIVEVDFNVSEPVVDLKSVGSVPIKGTMEMQRVRSVRECY